MGHILGRDWGWQREQRNIPAFGNGDSAGYREDIQGRDWGLRSKQRAEQDGHAREWQGQCGGTFQWKMGTVVGRNGSNVPGCVGDTSTDWGSQS